MTRIGNGFWAGSCLCLWGLEDVDRGGGARVGEIERGCEDEDEDANGVERGELCGLVFGGVDGIIENNDSVQLAKSLEVS